MKMVPTLRQGDLPDASSVEVLLAAAVLKPFNEISAVLDEDVIFSVYPLILHSRTMHTRQHLFLYVCNRCLPI
jgi:hypothetical protein